MWGMSSVPSIAPSPALVRPRAVSPESGLTLPLIDLAAELIARGDCRRIAIAGPPGAGKTTALAHLSLALPALPQAAFLEEPDQATLNLRAQQGPVFFAATDCAHADAVLRLAPWTDDDVIELLLTVAPQRCSDVIRRIQAAPDKDELLGNPSLWRLAVDQLLGDAALDSLRSAIGLVLDKFFPAGKRRRLAADFCVAHMMGDQNESLRLFKLLDPEAAAREHLRFLRQPFVQRLLAGQRLATLIRSGGNCPWLHHEQVLPRALVEELALWTQYDPVIADQLRAILTGKQRADHAQAATVLFAADPQWRPADNWQADLSRGAFPGARWAGIELGQAKLTRANLAGAILCDATLTGANLQRANLSGARLEKASLFGARAKHANFYRATLVAAELDRIDLTAADLRAAKFDDASLIGAELEEADLRRASFRHANLTLAVLLRSQVRDADFTGANLKGAILRHLALREAELTRAIFAEADLSHCDLEGIALESANFFKAKLHGAWLTGSQLPLADFRQADLSEAGLADIHWEHADLRWADLRGCSFHMGSSRSGLVGSPYPGHGSKTGFYTDDYNDQDFKAPEEIRKANLCGADLRGAILDGVDFYLVDLRGAQFDEEYAEHLTQCGAILYDRCA